MSNNNKSQKFYLALLYWAAGGLILGIVEILVNIGLHSWVLPNIYGYLAGPIIYTVLALLLGSILHVLYSQLSIRYIDCLHTATSIAITIFVWTVIWSEDYFGRTLSQHKSIHFSYILGLSFMSYIIGTVVFKFLVRQRNKDRLLPAFIALSCSAYTFIAIAIYFTTLKMYGLLSPMSLAYQSANFLGAIIIGLTVFYLLIFLDKYNLTIKLSTGVIVITGIIILLAYLPKEMHIPPKKISQKVQINILNKQEVIASNRPNILLITPDALRADSLSCYGYNRITTPNIDSLAKNGVMFKNNVSASPWTASSFGSMLTSLYPTVHHAGTKFSLEHPRKSHNGVIWLAQILKGIGYRTQAFTNNSYLNPKYGFKKGFDGYYNLNPNVINPSEKKKQELLTAQRRAFLWKHFERQAILKKESIQNETEIINKMAIDWLEKNYQNPFFLWVHYLDPHIPYDRIKEYNTDKKYTGRLSQYYQIRALSNNGLRIGQYKLNPRDKQYVKSVYDEEIMLLDENIERLFKKLRELNLTDNTIIIFTSDHGDEFWNHGNFGHGHTLYEEVIQVPLLIQYPKLLPKGVTIANQVRSIDIMPTILDILRVEHDMDLMGKSLLAFINGKETKDRIAFSESLLYYEERKAIKTARHKFIYFPDTGTYELYDIKNDPQEQKNIVDQQPETAAELKERLLAWMKDCQKKSEKYLQHTPEQVIFKGDAKERLKSLGYIQ